MNRYKKILVSLNLTELDRAVIRYVDMIVKLTRPDQVELVNVVNTRQVPKDIAAEYPALIDAAVESNEKALRELAAQHIEPSPSCDIQVRVFWGTPLEELVRHAKSQEIDLIIVGKDPGKARSGTLPERLARMAPCSVLAVPKGSQPRIRKILVPVDFSEHSAAAFERAVAFGKAAELSSLSCLHVYDVPGSYQKTGKTKEEFADIMKRSAEEGWRKFRRQLDPKGLELETHFKRAAYPTEAIKEAAGEFGVDFIVMGARGSSATKNLLLGSVSQRVINGTPVPLLTVKSKRESSGLMDVLYQIFGR